jgi:GTP-dependent phosphoenolpyruvate carboxykinase
MAKKEIACSINAACGNPAFAKMKPTSKPVNVAIVGDEVWFIEPQSNAWIRPDPRNKYYYIAI